MKSLLKLPLVDQVAQSIAVLPGYATAIESEGDRRAIWAESSVADRVGLATFRAVLVTAGKAGFAP